MQLDFCGENTNKILNFIGSQPVWNYVQKRFINPIYTIIECTWSFLQFWQWPSLYNFGPLSTMVFSWQEYTEKWKCSRKTFVIIRNVDINPPQWLWYQKHDKCWCQKLTPWKDFLCLCIPHTPLDLYFMSFELQL